jgi:hypothetical protein
MLSLSKRYRLVNNRLSRGTMRTCFFVTSTLAFTGRMTGILARFVGGM